MTVKTAISSYGTTAASTTGNQYLFPGGTVSASGSENFRDCEWSEPGTVSHLGIQLTVNGSTASFICVFRKNTADAGVSVSVAALATGEFTDTTNTATVAAGDNVCVRVGGHTTSGYTMRGVFWHFTPDTSGVAISRFGTVSAASYTTASTTRHGHNQAVNSFQASASEANANTRVRHAATAEYLHTRISANSRTTTQTIGLRINTADSSMAVSIGSTATGQFNDLVNTPSLAVDDQINLFHRTGTGTEGVTIQFIGCAMRSTAGDQTLSSWGSLTTYTTASGTTYRSLTGHTGASNGITGSQHVWYRAGIISDYCIRCPTNTRPDASTQTIADGSGTNTSISISVAASTTGAFQDTVNTDSFVSGDTYVSKLTLGGGAGGIVTNTHDSRLNPAQSNVTGSQATESTTANAGSPTMAPQGGQATETSTANAGAAVTGVVVAGSQATESSTANAGAPLLYVGGTQATETDTANAGAPSLTVAGSRASETSTGNAGAPRAYVGGSQATETSTATAGTAAIAVIGSQASETGTATAGAPAVTITGSRAEEETTAYAGSAVAALWGLLDLIVGRLHECWAMELRNPQLLIGDLHPPAWTVGEAHSAWSFGHLRL